MEQTQNESPPANLPAAAFAPAPCHCADGWTADRRRAFLAAIAEGRSVEHYGGSAETPNPPAVARHAVSAK